MSTLPVGVPTRVSIADYKVKAKAMDPERPMDISIDVELVLRPDPFGFLILERVEDSADEGK